MGKGRGGCDAFAVAVGGHILYFRDMNYLTYILLLIKLSQIKPLNHIHSVVRLNKGFYS